MNGNKDQKNLKILKKGLALFEIVLYNIIRVKDDTEKFNK